jgi:hypothetical protein
MTITFESNTDVIIYALEKMILYARRTGQIFVAQCMWWLALVIGLKQRLIVHIDNLRKREPSAPLGDYPGIIHPDRTQQILSEKAVPPTPKDLTEDQRLDKVLKSTEVYIEKSVRTRNTW